MLGAVDGHAYCALVGHRRRLWLLSLCALLLPLQVSHGSIFSSTLPSSRSVQAGQTASLFATIVTTSAVALTNCSVGLASSLDAAFTYQTTDATTNTPTGQPNTPTSIAAGGSQSFVLTLTSFSPIPSTDVEFEFVCDNAGPAPVVSGLNTLLFTADADPVPDIIALSATLGGVGISEIPKDNEFGFFTVATNNIGVTGEITVAGSVGNNSASADRILVCQTDALGACMEPPVSSTIEVRIAAGSTPTFAVFISNSGEIAFDPANNRVFLAFSQNGQVRGSTSVAFRGGGVTTARSLYGDTVGPESVQTRCIACHFDGGIAAGTRLVFEIGDDEATRQHNFEVFESYVGTVPDGANRILSKVQGALAHGGAVQIAGGTEEFSDLQEFLVRLGADVSATVNPNTLFGSTRLLSPRQTLRNAALLLAGRLPTADEIDVVAAGNDATLRATIRGLMQGEKFHQFLIEGANDRLLTDRQFRSHVAINPGDTFFVDYAQENFERASAVQGLPDGDRAVDEFYAWIGAVNYGFGRTPVELIAHVVENDKPYTEILTADYIMANPMANAAYGGDATFTDASDVAEFQPSHVLEYYRDSPTKVTNDVEFVGVEIINKGDAPTPNYPHAGILTTNAFLSRYPSTATNRNRARARWTYYFFLGFDIEKSAARTMDAEVLADTNNPTLNNSACTVCHEVMDPVAGAFQNFGDLGSYRDQRDGLDSLDDAYKTENGSPYQHGDTWYRDMRAPGFNGVLATDSETSTEWLAQQIVGDPRFAAASIRFWWPAIMGTRPLEAPEDDQDESFEANLLAFSAQNNFINDLAQEFGEGIAGGQPYNLKDMLVELIMSPWYRAASEESGDTLLMGALATAGHERLLTPEQLNRKTQAITGFTWGGFKEHFWGFPVTNSPLIREFRLYYGGIDSFGVTARNETPNAVMAGVAQAHAAQLSCPIVFREMVMLDDGDRMLFGGMSRFDTPRDVVEAQFTITADNFVDRQTVGLNADAPEPLRVTVRLAEGFHGGSNRDLLVDKLVIRNGLGEVVDTLEYEEESNLPGFYAECGYVDGDSSSPEGEYFKINGECDLAVEWTPTQHGVYSFEVIAWANQAGPALAELRLKIETQATDSGISPGAIKIKQKIADLAFAFLGQEWELDHPELERYYNYMLQSWNSKLQDPDQYQWLGAPAGTCDLYNSAHLYDGVAVDLLDETDTRSESFDRARVDAVIQSFSADDPKFMLNTWAFVVAAMLSDYQYLFF